MCRGENFTPGRFKQPYICTELLPVFREGHPNVLRECLCILKKQTFRWPFAGLRGAVQDAVQGFRAPFRASGCRSTQFDSAVSQIEQFRE